MNAVQRSSRVLGQHPKRGKAGWRLLLIQDAQGSVSVYATQDDDHTTVSLFFVNQTSSSQRINVEAESILPWSWWQGANLKLQGSSIRNVP